MKYSKIYFALITLTCIIYACSSSQLDNLSPLEESFLKLIAVDDVNNSLHVDIVYDERTEYKYGEDVVILIKNNSSKEIFLPSKSSALRAFVLNGDSWVEVENNIIYLGNGTILTPSGDAMAELINGIRPVFDPGLDGLEKKVIVRVLVLGEFMLNGEKTGQLVAAFAELIMQK